MAAAKLPAEQLELLRDLDRCVGRPSTTSFELEARGLAHNGVSRFGGYVKITDKGRLVLASHDPAAAPGPANAGDPPRGSTPRPRRKVEPAIKPPADVGATSKSRRRKSDA